MRILMLGWEFPPFISGGLGTACYGLTKALDGLGHHVQFVLPRAVDRSHASHVNLITPESAAPDGADAPVDGAAAPAQRAGVEVASRWRDESMPNVTFLGVSSPITSPYPGGVDRESVLQILQKVEQSGGEIDWEEIRALRDAGVDLPELRALLAGGAEAGPDADPSPGADYGGDVVGASGRYARMVLRLCRGRQFDVIHAHDWMTYPAGMAIARVSGRPLVVHIHSTEFDRSGVNVNQAVYDIERRGMHAAMRVIAVSMLTKSICVERYAVPAEKIEVVYNGIDRAEEQPSPEQSVARRDKIVLFLGRITMQKGPEYFVRAAKRVCEKVENVKFLVAGSGDMARRMIEHAAELGIGHKVLFTGFLRGADVQRVFKMADCYVMPSVSEPFGLAPLEAICQDTPAIISKQSGVSEVLTHALKVDFWDVDEMANKIVAVLKYPPLSQTLREHGRFEVRRLTWSGAAERCVQVYEQVAGEMHAHAGPAYPPG